MKFLIPTEPDDSHAMLVKLALESMGHHVRLLFTADQPTKQKTSIFIQGNQYLWKSTDEEQQVCDTQYDVVWWRRARKPYIPKERVHPDDYLFIHRENTLLYESLSYHLLPHAWWVNSKVSAQKANSKLLQLKVANQCGIDTPVTLCSNDPDDIRFFISQHEGVVYKPLATHCWFEEEQVRMAYTTKVEAETLPNDAALQVVPGIFQNEVKKQYELRITCFGDYLVAVKLHSQDHMQGQLDWRAIPSGQMKIEPYRLPPKLESQIRQFMRKLGIVFGAFDFIVTPEDDYIFLEVNEQGQFLWIEDFDPRFHMLDIFVSFLANKSRNFKWVASSKMHIIQQYQHRLDKMLEENLQRHIYLNQLGVMQGV